LRTLHGAHVSSGSCSSAFVRQRCAGQPREPLTIMSFNIRYGTAKDGENHWTARREMVFEVIREQDADLVGLQEAVASQIDEIVAAVPAYAVIGVGRDDAAREGEFSAILFRKDRLHAVQGWFETLLRYGVWELGLDRVVGGGQPSTPKHRWRIT
jgi:hypothetical protein